MLFGINIYLIDIIKNSNIVILNGIILGF